jgi:hypothetical protein
MRRATLLGSAATGKEIRGLQGMKAAQILVALAAASLIASLGAPAVDAGQPAEPTDAPVRSQRGVVTFLYENDVFGGADRNYTNGVLFSYVSPSQAPSHLARKIISMLWDADPQTRVRSGWGVGQSMFTPDDIAIAAPLVGQRPYAGWLYGFYGFSAEERDTVFTNVVIELGFVGPSAGAAWVQKNVHQAIDGQQPKGWDNQLKDEPGLGVTLERAWRLVPIRVSRGIGFDISPDLGVTLGNVRTESFGGITLRIGTDLRDTALPMRVRPSLAGSGAYERTQGWSWSAFAGIYGRAVARNIFLDGNTFRHSLSVDKHTFDADGQTGFAVRVGRLEISYTYVLRGEEYEGQHGNERFGAVGLSWHL